MRSLPQWKSTRFFHRKHFRIVSNAIFSTQYQHKKAKSLQINCCSFHFIHGPAICEAILKTNDTVSELPSKIKGSITQHQWFSRWIHIIYWAANVLCSLHTFSGIHFRMIKKNTHRISIGDAVKSISMSFPKFSILWHGTAHKMQNNRTIYIPFVDQPLKPKSGDRFCFGLVWFWTLVVRSQFS